MNKITSILILVVSLLTTGCGYLNIVVDSGGYGDYEEEPSYPVAKTRSFKSLGIPKGHLPPPGSYKVWYTNRPPGQQPAPTTWDNAKRGATFNSMILSRDKRDKGVLIVMEVVSVSPKRFRTTQYSIN